LKNKSQIKGLPNIKSIDGMVYKKYKYEFGTILKKKVPQMWKSHFDTFLFTVAILEKQII
jgi:hypothetical protein